MNKKNKKKCSLHVYNCVLCNIVSYMMKTVNTVMGLSLFVVLGGLSLAACKNKPVEETVAPSCCDAGNECCDAGSVEQQQPASSTPAVQPTDSDAGATETPAPSAPVAK